MKQRLIAISLLAVMLFSCAACGKTNAEEETDSAVYGATTKPAGGVYADGTNAPTTQPVAKSDMVSVTVPEGYTLLRLSWLLEEKGICTSTAFVEAAQNYDLSQNTLLSVRGVFVPCDLRI